MREEEGARYLSPLVKQDLAKLDTDGDTRRLAVKSLKLFAEQLDASTLPRFISQIAESRESGGTRCYAISMYEEVARVHGKLVVPHIPKIMAALVRASSASGSFPQLQAACARVAVALAQHGIDSTASQDEAEEIMREICTPLIDALAGKLEPVAATAAACIHTLAETEKWKYVREEAVHDVCQRTAVALSEKATRTAAHMQLIRILALVNPEILGLHGASLLRAGEDILKGAANPWQLRKAAAQLLQSVLTILDKETLETELNPALHALDGCRLDRMPHVRAAVSEALHTAKMLASGNAGKQTSGCTTPIRKERGTITPRAASRSPVRGSSRAASPTSQESRRLSLSSASTSSLESLHAMRSSVRGLKRGVSLPKRAPLYPARNSMGSLHSPRTPGTSRSSSTTTVEECQSPSRRLNVKEFKMQSRSAVSKENESEHVSISVRPRVPLQEVQDSDLPPLELPRDSTATNCPNIIDNSGPVQFLLGFENTRPSSSNGQIEVVLPRLKVGGVNNSDQPALSSCERKPIPETSSILSADQQSNSSDERTPVLEATSFISLETGLTNASELVDASSPNGESATADVEVEKRQIFTPEAPIQAAADAPQLSSLIQHFLKPLAHVDTNLEVEENISKDLLKAFVTPKRLVHSLSSLSAQGSEHDLKLDHEELTVSPTDAAETGSETGWSVRDNPIASEESEEEVRCRSVSPKLFSECSPREIRMISPCNSIRSSFDHASPREHACPSCVSTDQTCKARDGPIGLSCLQDETKSSKGSDACDQEAADETRSEEGLFAGKWRKLCWYMETALLGSLCLVVAVPLAMVVAKSVAESFGDSYFLVPT